MGNIYKNSVRYMLFRASELFNDLTKKVFGTYSFPADKWKAHVDQPAIGRTYFQDRKNDSTPFDDNCMEKMHLLYESALKDEMKVSSIMVSSRLHEVLRERFLADFDFLKFYDDDTEKLREAKRSYWLLVLDKVTAYMRGKDVVNEMPAVLIGEPARLRESLKPLASGTYTLELINAPEVQDEKERVKTLNFMAKEVFIEDKEAMDDYSGRKTKIMESINNISGNQKGIVLFFMNCSITNVAKFIEVFPEHSHLLIEKMPTCGATSDGDKPGWFSLEEWEKKKEDKTVCPLHEAQGYCIGYDIEEVKDGLESGISYLCIGSPQECDQLKKYIEGIKVFLVVPEKIEQLIFQMEARGYYAEEAVKRLKSLRDSIDYMMTVNDSFIIRWSEDQGDEAVLYYAGLIDSIITMNPITKQLNVGFLQEYKSVLENISGSK